MKILYIDTSSSFLYSAILENNKILSEIKKEFGTHLSEETLPEISKLFDKSNIKPNEINKIIVVNGPGSFTGIRIGITIAKVYAWALNIEILPISALEVMSISSENDKNHVPVLDARRKYVYCAIYDQNNNPIFEPKHILLEELKKEINKLDNYEIITNDEFESLDNVVNYNPNISKVVEFVKNRKGTSPHNVNPNYLKLTEAEESKLNDSRI